VALDFPSSSLTIGQIFSSGAISWAWDGTKWTPASSTNNPRYIVGCFVPGLLTASQVLLEFRFSKAVTFPANFSTYLGHTSEARGSAAATASTVIAVQKATAAAPTIFTGVGTITIAAGALTGTLATTGGTAVNYAQGDTLALIAPATPDATFRDVAATLVGYES
jgi:hypothetical protein